MPKLSPWKKYSAIAAIDSIADTGKLMRRKRMKSNFVSSGTMRRRRTARLSSGSFYVEHELLWNTKCFLQSSDRHDARTPQPHPIGDDQPGQGESREQRGDDADAERHRKAAHR